MTYRQIPIDDEGEWENEISELHQLHAIVEMMILTGVDAFAKERGYKNVRNVSRSRATLGCKLMRCRGIE